MKFRIFFSLLVLLYSCSKEEMTLYSATLKNNTNHNIKLLPYVNGVVIQTDTILLTPNSIVIIAEGSIRGISTVPGFQSKYFGGPEDSIIVVFDNAFRMAHYANLPSQTAVKFHPFSSNRNILNPLSYEFETISEGSTKQNNKHFFTFIEQDFLDTQ